MNYSRYWALLGAFIVTLLLAGCASKEVNIVYPDWFHNARDDSRHFYAASVGHSKEEATIVALNEIASRVSVNTQSSFVSSTATTNEQGKAKRYDKNTNRQIRNQTKKIEFASYEILKTKKLQNDQYAVLISVDREANAKQMLEKISTKLTKLEQSTKQENAIMSLKMQKQAKIELQEKLLPSFFIASSIYSSNNGLLDRINALQESIEQYKNKTKFYLQSDANNQEYANILLDYLNSQGYVVELGLQKNKLHILLTNKEQKIKSASNFVIKSTINIAIKEGNKSLKNSSVIASGISLSSYEQARSFAIGDFRKKLGEYLDL